MEESIRLDQTNPSTEGHPQTPVSFFVDDFIQEKQYDKGQAIWIAKIQTNFSNGPFLENNVYQDDGRYGEKDCAWLRLGKFLKEANSKIINLTLKFRSNVFSNVCKSDAVGYYFRNKITMSLFDKSHDDFMLVGHVENNKVYLQEWNVPSLIKVTEFTRDIDPNDSSLLLNF